MRRRLPIAAGGAPGGDRSRGRPDPGRPHPQGPLRPAVGGRRPNLSRRLAGRLLGDAQRRTGPALCRRDRARPADRAQPRPAARRLRPALGARRPAPRLRRAKRRGRRADGVGGRRQRRALPGADGGHQSSPALGRRIGVVGARRPAHRLRVGHARPRARRCQRRSDGHHALSLQADRRRGHDALQRQPPHPRVRRRRRHPAGLAAHRGRRLRALDRLGTGGRRGRVRVESRGRSRQDVQLRRLQRLGAHPTGAPTHHHQERGVLAGVVAGRHAPGVCRHPPRPHLVGDDDGGHPRLGDERRRQRPRRARRGPRQPPGRAAVVGRRPARLLRGAGPRRGAAGATARRRRRRGAGRDRARQRRRLGSGPLDPGLRVQRRPTVRRTSTRGTSAPRPARSAARP